ncbi:MAG: ferredoxin-thioredoxin reductase catalytic domain-containing protein [Methanoregula sp.]|jgi:ferredoxin-thioredoxin reductase catalytic subunit|uniref:ferredoxin-thioredoxin reductase catalytic domain-containing protein n=1 Tax=Methanoregula sp. TaxID=2052170 RepID=UPI003D0D0BBE
MIFEGLMETDVENLYQTLNREAEAGGYHLNPDIEFTKNLVRGLMKNERRYGYRSCPCRLASGKRAEDLDIICPCDYRDPDIAEYGACYCSLYVNNLIRAGEHLLFPVPERRPPRSQRSLKTVMATPGPILPFPVWRCKVCGYLCARDQPPDVCPICKATKDRFERFM